MLTVVNLTDPKEITGDVEVTLYIAGEKGLTIAVTVDGECVARLSVPSSGRIHDVIGRVSSEVAGKERLSCRAKLC